MTVTSIGVGLFGTEPAPRMVELIELSESLGFQHAWLGDSQNLWRDAYALMAAASQKTSRILLGTGVTNPVTRHLSVLASSWATLHELSGGRVALGIGTGDSSLRTMGMKPVTLATLEQRVEELKTLLTGGRVANPDAEADFHLNWVRPATIPVYIAASAPRILELAGRVADGVIMLVGTNPRFIEAALERVEVGARASHRRLEDLHIVLWAPTSIHADSSVARELVRAHVARVVIRPLAAPLDPGSMKRIETIRENYDYYKHMNTEASHADLVSDDLINHFALAGTAHECRGQLATIANLPIDQVAVVPYASPEGDRASVLETFATEVAQNVVVAR